MSVMKYERSVITITLHWHGFQIFSLVNCVDNTPTETGLTSTGPHRLMIWTALTLFGTKLAPVNQRYFL